MITSEEPYLSNDLQKTFCITIREAISSATKRLKSVSQTPKLDVLVLLEVAVKKDRSFLLAHDEEVLLPQQQEQFFKSVSLREFGLPTAYITGTKDFWKHTFFVSPSVLIPKPDTEILVEKALDKIQKLASDKTSTRKSLSILELCTGSGCIAVSLFSECMDSHISTKFIATDISPQALAVAKKNVLSVLKNLKEKSCLQDSFCCEFIEEKNRETFLQEESSLTLLQGDLFNALKKIHDETAIVDSFPLFDVIVSNPPYVTSDTTTELLKDGRNEPRLALDGGTDGLDLIKTIIKNAKNYLAPGGYIFLESGEDQTDAICKLFKKAGFSDIVVHKDFSGLNRVTEAKNG